MNEKHHLHPVGGRFLGAARTINNGVKWEASFKGNKEYKFIQQDMEHISSLINPVFLAISFCHCKNISITSDPYLPKLNKSRIKKGKLPFFRFNRLLIDPMKQILKNKGNSEKTGLKRALHICRGHFVTYTQEAPLFGRVTGTFWKPMHLRGNKKEGVVIKEYNIKPPSVSVPCPPTKNPTHNEPDLLSKLVEAAGVEPVAIESETP